MVFGQNNSVPKDTLEAVYDIVLTPNLVKVKDKMGMSKRTGARRHIINFSSFFLFWLCLIKLFVSVSFHSYCGG